MLLLQSINSNLITENAWRAKSKKVTPWLGGGEDFTIALSPVNKWTNTK